MIFGWLKSDYEIEMVYERLKRELGRRPMVIEIMKETGSDVSEVELCLQSLKDCDWCSRRNKWAYYPSNFGVNK